MANTSFLLHVLGCKMIFIFFITEGEGGVRSGGGLLHTCRRNGLSMSLISHILSKICLDVVSAFPV